MSLPDRAGGDWRSWSAGRWVCTGVAAVAAIYFALFLLTFLGRGPAGPGLSSTRAAGSTVAPFFPSASSTTALGVVPSTAQPSAATASSPSRPVSVPKPSRRPTASPTSRTPAPPSRVVPPNPQPPGVLPADPTLPTVLQLTVAGNTTTFFHALGRGDLATACAWWDPTSLAQVLTASRTTRCADLDPDTVADLVDPATTPADFLSEASVVDVVSPAAISESGGTAEVPVAALVPRGFSDRADVTLRLTAGLWRVVLPPAAGSPTAPPSITPPPVAARPATTAPPTGRCQC